MSEPPVHADTPRQMMKLRRLDVWVCRAPHDKPVVTSFGVMKDRPALFLRLEDADGAFGFGEVWCNFPAGGAEHRARLLIEELAELIFSIEAESPAGLSNALTERTHIRALQTGEGGPYAQIVAGLDIAAWDLAARRAGVPVRKLLDETAAGEVPAYASGIHIDGAADVIEACRAAGLSSFKVKVGFDQGQDARSLEAIALSLQQGERLFCDANQAWDVDGALNFLTALGEAPVGWLEEPLPADAPLGDWRRLAAASAIPLAAGENISTMRDFERVIASGAVTYIQPDIAKWGGFSGCLDVAQASARSGRIYCPHYLGGGIGLLASANMLAAAGGDGLLELDTNPNPLRDAFLAEAELGADGNFRLGTGDGLGVTELPQSLPDYEVLHETISG